MSTRSNYPHASEFLVVVCHALYEPWIEILNDGQLATWADLETPNIVHAYGIPVSGFARKLDIGYWNLKWSKRWGKVITAAEFAVSPFINRNIPRVQKGNMPSGSQSAVVQMPDFNFLMNKKTLALLKFGSTQNRKYVIFTTSSSYINLEVLQRELSELPGSKVVGGRIIDRNGKKFPSGSFRVFSTDVLIEVLQNLHNYKYWLPEDLALGDALAKLEVNYQPLGSLDLDNSISVGNLTEEKIKKVSHYRLKSELQGKRNDVALMKQLHLKISQRSS